MEFLKNDTDELTYEIEILTENKLMVAMGEEWGRDHYGVLDQQVHSAIFKMNNQQSPTV